MHHHGFSIRSERKSAHTVSAGQYVRSYYPAPKKYPGILGAIYEELYWLFRQFAFWIRYEWEDAELDEFDTQVIRHRPESIDLLCQQTKFTRKELQLMYRGFKQGCPTGMVTLDQFKQIYTQFFPHGAKEAGKYAQFVFNTFDRDGNGQISFAEFAISLSTLSRGSIDEKLEWIFQLYDINKRGQIAKNELYSVISSIYDLLGKCVEPPFDTRTVYRHVADLFTKMDRDQDGVISKEEFILACSEHAHQPGMKCISVGVLLNYMGSAVSAAVSTARLVRTSSCRLKDSLKRPITDDYAALVFRTFDANLDRVISFKEFLMVLATLTRGSIQQKLMWIFYLYDVDNDGYISMNDIHHVVKSVYGMVGIYADPPVHPTEMKDHAREIFKKFDKSNRGIVSCDEFMACCIEVWT